MTECLGRVWEPIWPWRVHRTSISHLLISISPTAAATRHAHPIRNKKGGVHICTIRGGNRGKLNVPAISEKSLQFNRKRIPPSPLSTQTSVFNGRRTIFLVEPTAYTYDATNSSSVGCGRDNTFLDLPFIVDYRLLLAFRTVPVPSPMFLQVLNVRNALSMRLATGLCTAV